jgi:hypothetical protein
MRSVAIFLWWEMQIFWAIKIHYSPLWLIFEVKMLVCKQSLDYPPLKLEQVQLWKKA